MRGLKFDLRRAAIAYRKQLSYIKKKKLVDITFESMSSPSNGMRGAQLSLSAKLT